jgi:hypothetical protein
MATCRQARHRSRQRTGPGTRRRHLRCLAGNPTGSLASRIGSREQIGPEVRVPREGNLPAKVAAPVEQCAYQSQFYSHFPPFRSSRPGKPALQQNEWESPQTPPCSWKVGAMSGALAALAVGTSRGTSSTAEARVGPSFPWVQKPPAKGECVGARPGPLTGH